MKHRIRKAFAAIAGVIAILLMTSVVSTAYETGAIDPVGPMILSIRPEADQVVDEYNWPRIGRLLAEPLVIADPLTPETLAEEFVAEQTAVVEGAPGFVHGRPPLPDIDARARAEFPEEWDDELTKEFIAEIEGIDSEGSQASSGFGEYTAFVGNKYPQMWKHHPYRAIGKLFFSTPNGLAYCTASVIGPNLILTAAQCVLDTQTDTAYSSFSFCPAARETNCPYGTFPWSSAYVSSDFLKTPDWQSAMYSDVALLELESNRAGEDVHTYTGWLGRSWNLPPNRHAFAVGYPGIKAGDGFSHICAGESFEVGADVQEMGCDSGFGHLGGPWIVNFAPYVVEGANYINSLTSYQYTRGRNAIGSPRLSMEDIGGLCAAVEGC